MAALQLLWDIMLVGTMLYYHRMIEKFVSGIIAILTWYFTYRYWYRSGMLPDPAGSGSFFYQRDSKENFVFKRNSSGSSASTTTATNMPSNISGLRSAFNNNGSNNGQAAQVPRFMGMPLYTNPKATQSQIGGNDS